MILFEDLGDKAGILKAIQELSDANVSYGNVAEETNQRIKQSIIELRKELLSYQQLVQAAKDPKSIFGLKDDVVKLTTSYKEQNIAIAENQRVTESNNRVIAQMQDRLKQLQQEYEKLDLSQKNDIKRKKEIERELTQTTRAVNGLTTATSTAGKTIKAAENSFNALKQQTRDLKKQLDAMPDAYVKGTGKINEQNRAVVALNGQYQKNIALINQIERGQKNFRGNVGNYPQTEQSNQFSSLAIGAVGGGAALVGDKILDGLKAAGDIILQYDSLDSALQVVSNDTVLFTQRQKMLQRVSDDLGQDLAVVEKTYTNLTASSKGTRLEGEATDKIFTAVTGTMGRLKKSGADTEGALLAIGQMMSKGTVQSEELRGQLGERLPGAFNIAAKSLGVTTSKLGDMLKNGEVLSSDFLPKFAAELERTFNPNHQQRVQGLAANLARLRNEGVEWVKSINIGDSAGEFIGNITSMSRAVREFFSSAVDESTRKLADQTETVQRLESELPNLLIRYDELKNKSKLSTDEQKELQVVVNSLVGLVPSAATGFDAYGNALDVNKGKVLSFTAAQRQLNAELNKAAIDELKKQTAGGIQQTEQTQSQLNRGTKQKSFNWKPYAMMSAEERQQATAKDAGKRREVSLTDNDRRDLQGQLQAQNKQIEASLVQRLQLGDKLDAASEKYIESSGSSALKQYKVVNDYNTKISDLNTKQADLLLKGDKDSLKQRESIIKEMGAYKKKVADILNPSTVTNSGSDKPEQSQSAANKVKAEAERQLREAVSKSQATTGNQLADLNNDHQAGLISEQAFIEQRLKITVDGLNERQAILEKAGKKETDDYVNIQKEKKKADTEYSRSQLQLDLKGNKATTDKSLAGLDRQKGEDDLTELDYIDKRHSLIIAGIKRDQTTLKEAGQEQTELYRATETAIDEEQAEHQNKRLQAVKKAYKDELATVRDSLKELDQQASANYETRLAESHTFYTSLREQVEEAQSLGNISPTQARDSLHLIDVNEIKAELTILQQVIAESKALTHGYIQDRIDQQNNFIAYSGASEKELSEYKKQIAELEKQQKKSDADFDIKLQKEVADNDIKQTDKTHKHKKEKNDEERQMRKAVLDAAIQGGATLVNELFTTSQQELSNQQSALDRKEAYELQSVGDNEAAKASIQKKYDNERKVLQRKEAVANKQQALFNIAIAGAQGVISALASLPPNVPLAFLIGGLAIAQAGIVAARPIPEFFAGKNFDSLTNDNYAGPAIAGERGREIWQHDGVAELVDKPSLINVGRNDTIYPNYMTESMLEGKAIASRVKQQTSASRTMVHNKEAYQVRQYSRAMSLDGGTINQIVNGIAKANEKLPFNMVTFDERGVLNWFIDGHNKTLDRNRNIRNSPRKS